VSSFGGFGSAEERFLGSRVGGCGRFGESLKIRAIGFGDGSLSWAQSFPSNAMPLKQFLAA